MPRYYFHIRQGDGFVEDPHGIEVAQPESLEEEAIEAALDLLAEGDLQGVDRREWVYEIADESGRTVLLFRFEDAIEPDLPLDLPEADDGEGDPNPPTDPAG